MFYEMLDVNRLFPGPYFLIYKVGSSYGSVILKDSLDSDLDCESKILFPALPVGEGLSLLRYRLLMLVQEIWFCSLKYSMVAIYFFLCNYSVASINICA